MKMPEPVAWIRGSGLEMLKLENGGVATVFASDGMSNYSHPLYDKQALIDLLEAAINSYSPDDTAMDYINKLIDMKETL